MYIKGIITQSIKGSSFPPSVHSSNVPSFHLTRNNLLTNQHQIVLLFFNTMAIGMKLQAMALVGLFLPLAILAAPSADPASAPADKAPKKAARPVAGDTSPEAIGLTKRTNVNCYIVNVDNYANCRSGPGTGYDITGAVYEGDLYTFQCYEPGECFDGNW